MATEDTLGARYEMRRKARGAEPPPERKVWRRRLILIGVGLLVVVLLVVGVFVWLALTRVNTVNTTVEAAVIPVPSTTDGLLAELYVHVHDQVTKGQEMVKLDDPQLRAALQAAEATVALDQSLYDQALAEQKLTETRVKSDLDSAKARVQQAEAAIGMRQARLAEEIRQAQAQRDQAKADLARVRKGARREDVLASEARLESAKALLALYVLEVRQSEQLVGEGIDSQFILETKKTRLATQQSAVREAELELERLNAGPTPEEIESATQALNAREAALALCQAAATEIDNLKAELVIRQADLENAKTAEGQRIVAQKRVEAAAAALKGAKDRLAATQASLVIPSPVTGTVVRIFSHVGDTCRQREQVLQVTDDSQGRWISAYVREKDAFYVRPGQRAKVKLASGEHVAATVVSVGAATSSMDRQGIVGTNETQQFGPELVRVRLGPVEPLKSNPLPGMSARAVILIRTKASEPQPTGLARRP